jgi:serine/threonine-protein kinase
MGSTYFLAMEFVDGVTLGAVARRAEDEGRTLATDVVSFIGREVLAGLAHAHEGVFGEDGHSLRIVHRDVCPQNILLSRNGEVKVADFGIARVLGDAISTQTRTIAGHFAYLAPEQATGRPIDERSDLFAVAVVIWELLAGQRLFFGDNEVSTLMAVMNKEIPPISRCRASLDQAWDLFFLRALDRDPSGRFTSAREMAQALATLPGAQAQDSAERLSALVETWRGRSDALPEEAMATRVMVDATAEPTRVAGARQSRG